MGTNHWYIASLLKRRRAAAGSHMTARRCQFLVEAQNHEEAYRQALQRGNRSSSKAYEFIGILDLLMIEDRPVEGAELLWSESEMPAAETESRIHKNEDTRASREGSSATGWYIASLFLSEVHDEGSHGDLSLTWGNSYLIRAQSPGDAYKKAIRIGVEQQDEPGSHTCDGEKAHWEFRGVHDIIPVAEIPGPGSLLWCDEIHVTAEEMKSMIPEKSELGVFRWEADQTQRRRL